MAQTQAPTLDLSAGMEPISASAATPAPASAAPLDLSAGMEPISGPAPAPGTTGVGRFVNQIGEGGAEASRDIYGVAKGMVPGGPAEAGALQTVWNNLPPVQLADSVKQTLPLIHAYEQSRSKGASISDSLAAANEAAKQHTANLVQLQPIVDAFKANPTRETARAVLDTVAAATSLLAGGEAATPEAEAAATAAKVPAAAAASPAEERILTRLTNPFRKAASAAKSYIPTTTPIQDVARVTAAEPGSTAVRTATGAGAETPILAGAKTVADESLADLATKKSAAYKQIDDLVGFDRKAEIQKMKDTEYAMKQPGASMDIMKLQGELADSQLRIAVADKKLAAAGIDPKAADNLNTAWEAGKQFRQGLVTASDSEGNVTVQKLLNSGKTLRTNPKYGDRLAQFFGKGDAAAGKPIADAYMQELQAAQRAGVHAVSAQRIARWTARVLAGGLVGGGAVDFAEHLLAP